MARFCHLICLVFGVFSRQALSASCKVSPDSPLWPLQSAWQTLNTSISGRLIKPTPPGAACHPGWPHYNNASCNAVLSQWSNSSFHLSNPATGDYNDESCLPSSSAPCSSSGYPAYVVAATCAEDVQAGVRFAEETGLRLIVKGTGHDFPGRSSGPGTLSMWTHGIRGIEFNYKDNRTFNGAVATAKIAAGMVVKDLLEAAASHNLTVVTASDHTVGIGGWLASGGHGPVTSRYGMGADQVVEIDVVTADGRLLTINANSYPDLFWAMRGGGGSTFGVMVSATVLAYPNLPGSFVTVAYNTTALSDTFWDLLTLFHTHVPQLSEAGVMGYYYINTNDTTVAGPPKGTITSAFLVPEKSASDAQALFKPLESQIKAFNWTDKVSISNTASYFTSYSSTWLKAPPESVGFNGRLGSRLLDKQALTSDPAKLKASLKKSSSPTSMMRGHMVAGPGPRQIAVPGGGNAVLPAWRQAYTHLAIDVVWGDLDPAGKANATAELRDRVQALKDLAPNTGAYVSEADPSEPDWQRTYWGENYPRLLRLKEEWDPEGVFWCVPCVGHELWTVAGGDGIGQDGGRICRA